LGRENGGVLLRLRRRGFAGILCGPQKAGSTAAVNACDEVQKIFFAGISNTRPRHASNAPRVQPALAQNRPRLLSGVAMTRRPAWTFRSAAALASALLPGALVLTVATAIAADPAPTARPPRAHSERIGSVGKGYRMRSLAVSRDMKRIAWIDQRGERCRVVVDRERGPWFARCTNPIFSPDGSTVAYFSSEKVEEAPLVHLIVGGKASKADLGNEGPVAFGEHGGAWAAVAPARAPVPAEGAPTPSEAPPRRMIAFGQGGVVGEYHDTTAPVISPDGAHAAFVASDATGTQRLILDGKVARDFGSPDVDFLPVIKTTRPQPNLEPEAMVRFLSDGSLAGIVLAANGWTVFHGDTAWASYPGIRLPESSGFEVTGSPLLSRPAVMGGSLVAAAKAPVACWWQRQEGDAEQWQVVCNGKPIDDQVCNAPGPGQPIVVTPDGRATMYVCQVVGDPLPDGKPDERNLWVVAAGKKHGPHRFVWGLDLTPDAQHAAFAAADGVDDTWFYDFDGKRFDGPWQHAFPATISPDAKSIAWAASPHEDGKRVDLVRDGDVVTRGDMVMAPPRWTGERVEFALKRGHSVRRVVID
jgi:hypothetical protein